MSPRVIKFHSNLVQMNAYLSESINNSFIETAIEKELKKALFQIYIKCIFMIKSNCIKFFLKYLLSNF